MGLLLQHDPDLCRLIRSYHRLRPTLAQSLPASVETATGDGYDCDTCASGNAARGAVLGIRASALVFIRWSPRVAART